MQEYADPVIDWLDAGRGILDQRFFRDVSVTAPLPSVRFIEMPSVLYTASKWFIH